MFSEECFAHIIQTSYYKKCSSRSCYVRTFMFVTFCIYKVSFLNIRIDFKDFVETSFIFASCWQNHKEMLAQIFDFWNYLTDNSTFIVILIKISKGIKPRWPPYWLLPCTGCLHIGTNIVLVSYGISLYSNVNLFVINLIVKFQEKLLFKNSGIHITPSMFTNGYFNVSH